jgi:hypothetical protein
MQNKVEVFDQRLQWSWHHFTPKYGDDPPDGNHARKTSHGQQNPILHKARTKSSHQSIPDTNGQLQEQGHEVSFLNSLLSVPTRLVAGLELRDTLS